MDNKYHPQEEFYSLVKESKENLQGSCPLVEDEAIIWAAEKIAETQDLITEMKVLTEHMEQNAAHRRDDNLHREAAIIDSYAQDIRKIFVSYAMKQNDNIK